jgi:hypothetical protein
LAALKPNTLNPLPRWQRRGLYTSLAALTLSGVLWWVAHYSWGAGAGELPHPLELWMIRLHGAAAMASLFFTGVLATVHMPRGWRLKQQRRTGATLVAGMATLVLSGYALYYVAPETWRTLVGNSHAAVGLVVAAVLLWHGRLLRRYKTA